VKLSALTAILVATSLLLARAAKAETRSFNAGSIIIPMDQCYQTVNGSTPTGWTSGRCGGSGGLTCYNAGRSYPAGDIPHAFGVIYLLLQNNIPVRMTMRPDKQSLADADFSVSSSAGQPATALLRYANGSYTVDTTAMNNGTNTVSYSGGAFIIDASYTPRALAVLGAFNQTWSALLATVNLHLAQSDFTAPVLVTLASRPKPAGILNGSGLESYFQMTGIPNVVGNGNATLGGAGNSYVLVTQAANGTPSYVWTAAPPGACDGAGNCSSFTYTPAGQTATARILDVVWISGSSVGNWSTLASNGLNQLLANGGRLLATDQAAITVENGASGSPALHYLTASGLVGNSNGQSAGPYCAGAFSGTTAISGTGLAPPQYPASNPYLTVGDEAFATVGNGQSSSYSPSSQPFRDGVQGLESSNTNKGSIVPVMVGHPTLPGTTTPASGTVIYEGGGNAWNLTSFKDAGLHIMYDSLINGGAGVGDASEEFTPTELTHATPVGDPFGTPKFYLGSFEWKVPSNSKVAGNTLWRPSAASYPNTRGHFREYNGTSSTPSLSCNGSVCNWDAATAIAAQGTRTILVPVLQNGSWTLTNATSLQASDVAIDYVMKNLGGALGGIDHSTAAVVQGKGRASLVTVANAPNRPSIAYVGAADGMIHAICVSASCYGKATGQEIWAVIPPAVRTQMQAAYAASDWSAVKVDGAIRVADTLDTFDPAQPQALVYRTILVASMRSAASWVALDVSDPNPANLNQQGFRFLWQNDGTTVDASVTCPAAGGCSMGLSEGVSFAKPASANTLVGLATAATSSKTTSGVNTYYVRLSDGKIMSFDQRLYTKLIPLPAGGRAALPNDVPALATTLDVDNDGIDDVGHVPDYEGRMRRFPLSATRLGSATVVLDTTIGCAAGMACQPISTSPAISRTNTSPTTPTYDAIVATGGADWARSTTTLPYAVYAVDGAATATTTAPVFQRSVLAATPDGQLVTPTGPMPLRVYGQPTVSGGDLWVQATTLAANNTSQLLMPIMFPPASTQAYGLALRWRNVSTTIDTTSMPFQAAGGSSSIVVTGTKDSPGAVDIVGGSQIQSYVLKAGDSSVPNPMYSLTPLGAQRLFKTISWYDLSE